MGRIMINKFVVLNDRMNLYNAANKVAEMAYEEGYSYLDLNEYKILAALCAKILDGISKEMNKMFG